MVCVCVCVRVCVCGCARVCSVIHALRSRIETTAALNPFVAIALVLILHHLYLHLLYRALCSMAFIS